MPTGTRRLRFLFSEAVGTVIHYNGAKWSVADELIEASPPGMMYVDVFGGSAACAVAAQKSGKWKSIVYNDLADAMFNLLLCIRDRPQELAENLALTPHARAGIEWASEELKAVEVGSMLHANDATRMRHAVAALICIMQGAKRSPSTVRAKRGNWRREAINADGNVSVMAPWAGLGAKVLAMSKLLAGISMENRDWATVLERYDYGPQVMLNVDPPYEGGSEEHYHLVLSDASRGELLCRCLGAKSNVLYHASTTCGEAESAFAGWEAMELTYNSRNNNAGERRNIFYANFDLRGQQLSLENFCDETSSGVRSGVECDNNEGRN